jgi:hypothetical protein
VVAGFGVIMGDFIGFGEAIIFFGIGEPFMLFIGAMLLIGAGEDWASATPDMTAHPASAAKSIRFTRFSFAEKVLERQYAARASAPHRHTDIARASKRDEWPSKKEHRRSAVLFGSNVLRGYFVEPPFIESWFIIACGAAVGFMALPFIELPFIAAWAIFGAGVAFMAACIALCAIAEGAGELWASAEPVSAPHMSATESMVRIEGSLVAIRR